MCVCVCLVEHRVYMCGQVVCLECVRAFGYVKPKALACAKGMSRGPLIVDRGLFVRM